MKIQFFAIAIGLLTDLILSVLAAPLEQLVILTPTTGRENATFYISSLIFGLIATLIGGAVTAYLSRSNKMANTSIYGILEECLGLALLFVTPAPFWFTFLSMLFIIPASLSGACHPDGPRWGYVRSA
jgi:hypothetical protein